MNDTDIRTAWIGTGRHRRRETWLRSTTFITMTPYAITINRGSASGAGRACRPFAATIRPNWRGSR